MSELAQFRCHKIVRAGKISYVEPTEPTGGSRILKIVATNGEPLVKLLEGEFFARGAPKVGDYFVVYEDGYQSWSPAKAFGEGYTRL